MICKNECLDFCTWRWRRHILWR